MIQGPGAAGGDMMPWKGLAFSSKKCVSQKVCQCPKPLMADGVGLNPSP